MRQGFVQSASRTGLTQSFQRDYAWSQEENSHSSCLGMSQGFQGSCTMVDEFPGPGPVRSVRQVVEGIYWLSKLHIMSSVPKVVLSG